MPFRHYLDDTSKRWIHRLLQWKRTREPVTKLEPGSALLYFCEQDAGRMEIHEWSSSPKRPPNLWPNFPKPVAWKFKYLCSGLWSTPIASNDEPMRIVKNPAFCISNRNMPCGVVPTNTGFADVWIVFLPIDTDICPFKTLTSMSWPLTQFPPIVKRVMYRAFVHVSTSSPMFVTLAIILSSAVLVLACNGTRRNSQTPGL